MTTADKVIEKLDNCKPKDDTPDGARQYRSNSPLRPGSDSGSFSLLIEPDGEHGTWNDFVSGEHGSLYDLAGKLGITPEPRTNEPLTIVTTKRAYKDKDDYARAHHVPWDAFDAWDWTPDTWKEKGVSRPALRFVTQTGSRWRLLDAGNDRYRHEHGYQMCWYGLKKAMPIISTTGQPLVFCNGAPSVIVAQWFGVAAFAISSSEDTTIPNDMIAELKERYPVGQIIVALDCDPKGRKASPKMAKQFRDAGYDVREVDLGLNENQDLADFCALHNPDAVKALQELPGLAIAKESPALDRPQRIIHADRLAELPPLKWLVPDILPDNGIAMLVGAPGSGKSFYALSIAFEVAQQFPVVYMASEGAAGYAKRLAALNKHTGKGNGQLYFHPAAVQMLDPTDRDSFIGQVRDAVQNPKLIIIDTLARTMAGGDENKTADMSRYYAAADKIRQAFDCAVWIVHHSGKNGRLPRGSSVIQGNFDVIVGLNKEDDVIVIECQKTKDAEPFETRYKRMIKVDLPEGENSLVMIDADKVTDSDSDKLTPNQRQVLDVLAMEVNADGLTFAEVESVTEIAKSSLNRVFNTLLTRKYISKSGRLMSITTEGRKKFAQSVFSKPAAATRNATPGTNDENCELCEQADDYGKTDANKSANSMRTDANKSIDDESSTHENSSKSVSNANKPQGDQPALPIEHPQQMFLRDPKDKAETYFSRGA